MEMAGAAICTNSVAEIMRGVPPRGRDLQKPPGGMSERRQWVGHMRGVPSDTAAAFEKLERLSYYVSRAGPSRSRLKAQAGAGSVIRSYNPRPNTPPARTAHPYGSIGPRCALPAYPRGARAGYIVEFERAFFT